MYKLSVLALALSASAVAFIAGSPAQAQVMTRSVSYADLDLSSPAGISTLERRIDRAISAVCDSASGGPLKASAQVRNCRREARASTAPQLSAAVDKARGDAYAFAGKSDR